MKIHILSDLHLEHGAFVPPPTDADVVVLAGDIGSIAHGVAWAQRAFPDKRVLYVPGNHEFYGSNPTGVLAKMREAAQHSNVTILDRNELTLDGVRFLGVTLWTDFEIMGLPYQDFAMHACRDFMADYSVISKGDRLLTPKDTQKFHERDRDWLARRLRAPFQGPTVVITHHAPHPCSVADRYRAQLLTAGFASDLSELMGFKGLWVHGHTHDAFDYMLGDTRVVCNPRGYPREQSPSPIQFNPGLVLEV